MDWLKLKKSPSRILYGLYPELRLVGEQYEALWLEKKRASLHFLQTFVLPLVAIGQILHFLIIDRKIAGDPFAFWLPYRLKVAGIAALCLALLLPMIYRRLPFPRLPLFIAGAVLVILQTNSIDATQYPVNPYWSFVFLFAWCFLMSMNSLFTSILFLISSIILMMLYPALVERAGFHACLSIIITCLFIILMSKVSHAMEISKFVSDHENEAAQRKAAEASRLAMATLSRFAGPEITERINKQLKLYRLPYDVVLSSIVAKRSCNVALVWTDMRNYTETSKDREALASVMIPRIKSITKILDKNRGISRNIGDLNFAYFDQNDERTLIRRALLSAVQIVALELESSFMNRFVIISFGEAFTGNVTGSEDTYEITAMGVPVNLAQRLDELTKTKAFQSHVNPNSIVLSQSSCEIANQYFPNLRINILPLAPNNLQIRSFENDFEYIGFISFTHEKRDVFINELEEETK